MPLQIARQGVQIPGPFDASARGRGHRDCVCNTFLIIELRIAWRQLVFQMHWADRAAGRGCLSDHVRAREALP